MTTIQKVASMQTACTNMEKSSCSMNKLHQLLEMALPQKMRIKKVYIH